MGMSRRVRRCNEPHPDIEHNGIRCDFEEGHVPVEAFGPRSGPTRWSHGDAVNGYWWGNPDWISDEDDRVAWGNDA